ncbi:hypothetical protein [Hippea sp. KM1]|uniref:hypothetical protein n=1 Tax=Hippea sp. KM1 TaxID=944481 RepID=UPI00046D9164|nr:hypothetical protein [Hippea sp. KM1]
MKVKGIIIAIIVSLIVGGFMVKTKASQSEHYNMNQALCQKYIEMSTQAYNKDDLYSAKLYAQKAVQENPWCKAAWDNYNRILINITGGDINRIPEPKKEEAAPAAEAPTAGGEEEEIEGC